MSGEEQLMAAMGFSSFGRPRHERHHTKQVTNAKTDTLPQLMPGTELAGKLAEFSSGSVEDGPHGVVYLLCKENGPTALEAALDQGSSEDDKGFAVSYSELLAELEQEKQKFDKLESSTFLSARAATNAFEKLGRHRFLNRSAMKLVTLDHIFQWTRGSDQGEKSFSFADICGGPGGFSEYLLWRAKQLSGGSNDEDRKTPLVHGYGITLKGAANYCDWRLPSKCMELFDVCYGEDGTGNLYSIANIHNFRDVVRVLHPSGVDLAVADGGFLDARSQSNQESMMTKLILAEVLAMFAVLRVGGDFVCKTFEMATPPMLQLCWILHQCFDRFAVVKPITSRPASSERYIVARGLRPGCPSTKLVETLEGRLVESSSSSASDDFQLYLLPTVFPVCEDIEFLQYMAEANGAISRNQLQACRRINEFAANKNKRKTREGHTDIDPQQYYQCWQLGNVSRGKPTL